MAEIAERPKVFSLSTQTGMLEALGINMYTSLGKCLVEFGANSYDSDASVLQITVPFEQIQQERAIVRAAARASVARGERDAFSVLRDPLPESVSIIIQDDGHGMDENDVQKKFLPINRNRREAVGDKSESGARFVMGRKGLGKLAGFGTAEKITIRTKRKGTTYATSFVMDYAKILEVKDLSDVKLPAAYEEGLPAEEKGTSITLERLRCDALKGGEAAIRQTLADNFFGLKEEDFRIELNNVVVKPEEAAYEFEWPEAEKRDANGFGNAVVNVEDVGAIPIQYIVKFRARAEDPVLPGAELRVRGSLPATRRGARIYCNNRLVAGPSLFRLETGMHNFHSQSYMECVVNADELDRHKVDLISTNRSDLRYDNEVVDRLIDEITDLMRKALYAHGQYRDAKVEKDIEEDEFGAALTRRLGGMSRKAQRPAKRVLRILASEQGVKGQLFREVAPLVLDSMNAGEVLSRLIELGTDPKNMQTVISELANLDDVERRDLLKLFRGRRNAITALSKLMERAEDPKGPKFEKALHTLLKQDPWLIKPEYSRYITTDRPMNEVARKLTAALKIDYKGLNAEGEPIDAALRPDLVFLAVNSPTPNLTTIVELKSPNVLLNMDHLVQLQDYMNQVQAILDADLSRSVAVHGHLIGNLPSKLSAKNKEERVLLSQIQEKGPETKWEVLTLPALLERTRSVHLEWIEALEADDEDAGGD
jgi:hypothetical protein